MIYHIADLRSLVDCQVCADTEYHMDIIAEQLCESALFNHH
jgi:hypothetical protein